jgi:hypothetical protein
MYCRDKLKVSLFTNLEAYLHNSSNSLALASDNLFFKDTFRSAKVLREKIDKEMFNPVSAAFIVNSR